MTEPVIDDLLLPLPEVGSWPASVHLLERRGQWAIRAALAAQRPLLLEGEPGCGKSHFARAAAVLLKRAFVSTVVHSRTTVEDLQYHYDVVARLAEAQTLAARGLADQLDERLAPRRFLRPGPLWWVFGPPSARDQLMLQSGNTTPDVESWNHPGFHAPPNWQPLHGAVLLIDEIDKAESELPNGLLETLGNGAFVVPQIHQAIGLDPTAAKPLVVITTNAERELPYAFRRRCLALALHPPEDDKSYSAWLVRLGQAHGCASQRVRALAAERLLTERRAARDAGLPKPGTAEYLDLLRALTALASDQGRAEDEAYQLDLLEELAQFTLCKYREREG